MAGGRVIAAMERESNGFDFRSNISGGGEGKIIKLSSKMEKMAIKATQTLGLDYGGVDLIKTKTGPRIIEVNPNPGLRIEYFTNINVTGEILKCLIK